MERSEYDILIEINGRKFRRLIIDPHYSEKHKTISDELIIQLVGQLHGQSFRPDSVSKDGYEYYAEDKMILKSKLYKLIWTLKVGDNFIGIINCYRRD